MAEDGTHDLSGTVTIGVSALDDVRGRMRAAFSGETQGAFISFASPELMWKVLTAKRWEIIRAMTGAGELSIREVARRVGRDVKAVHGDVTALILAGVLDRSKVGVIFPYDSVRVDFTLTKAA
jgi:predicted transcriptional regulator